MDPRDPSKERNRSAPKGKREPDDDVEARDEWFFASRRDTEGEVLKGAVGRGIAKRRATERNQRDKPHASEPTEKAPDTEDEPSAPSEGEDAPGGEAPHNGGEPTGGTPGAPGSVNWTPIGPSALARSTGQNMAVSGRIRGLVAGPGGSRVYAGAANGGIWFSPDSGASWTPLDDYVASPSFVSSVEADSLSVGAVAVGFGTSAATDNIYVGTGEATANYDRYYGIGIRHSPSGGAPGTWTLDATNLAGRGVHGIVIDPDDPSIVLAATTQGLFRRPAAAPFTTWTQVTSPAFTSPNAQATSIVVAGTGASKRYYLAFVNGTAYQSSDANTWLALTGLGAGRIVLGVAPSDPTVVYAFRQDATLARLVGTAFQAVTGLPASAILPGSQGWYDLAIAVHPTDPNTIILGGDWYAVFRGTISTAGGNFTFPFIAANAGAPYNDPTWVGQSVHSDVHTIAFAWNAAGTALDPNNVWVGCDGGVYQSTTGAVASSFRSRNIGLAITQSAFISQRPDTDAVVFAGSQDNGTNQLFGEQAGVVVMGGDGGGIAVDQNDPYRVMRQYVRASLDRSTAGGGRGTWSAVPFPPKTAATPAQQTAADTENGQTGFLAPIASSPAGVSPGLVAFGTRRLWLSSDWGTTWVTLPTGTNPYTPATPDLTQDNIETNSIVAIEIASATLIYAATFRTVCRYDKSGATWTRTTLPNTGLPALLFITDLSVHDAAAGTLYATLGSGGVAHLYYFNGTSWNIAMPTSVVDVPTHAVVTDPDNPQIVYVGTDVGCWKGTKTGATTWSWTVLSGGLPEAAIVDLAIQRRARLLRASTHGRGVWEIELDSASGLTTELYLRVNDADNGRTPGGSRFSWLEGAEDPLRQGRTVYHWMSPDIKVRRPSLAGTPALGTPPDFLDFAVNIGDYVDTSNAETADASGVNRIFVEVHNRSLTPVPAAQVRACLLLTDAYAGLPPLPADYAARINAGDTSSTWLAGSQWRFADSASPYRVPSQALDVRTPQVVEFNVDFTSLSLPLGHDHVCAAAFVTSSLDPITSTGTNLDQLTMQDRHVAHRNLHLVAAGAMPSTEGGSEAFEQEPQTFLVSFHNPDEVDTIDIKFDVGELQTPLTVMLPKAVAERLDAESLEGFVAPRHTGLLQSLQEHMGRWLERLGEAIEDIGDVVEDFGEALAQDLDDDDDARDIERTRKRAKRVLMGIDHKNVLVAEAEVKEAVLKGIPLEQGESFTAAISVAAPADARPGDSYRFDVIQRNSDKIVGGSTYLLLVTGVEKLQKGSM